MRREGSVGRLLSRAFAVLVVLIVGSGAAELAAVLIERQVVQQLTDEVQPLQLANAEVRAVLTDAQRGLRGYLLTGDERMLDTYYLARSDYAVAGDELRRLSGERHASSAAVQIARADGWWANAEEQRLEPPRSAAAARYAERGTTLFQAFGTVNDELRLTLEGRSADLRAQVGTLQGVAIAVVSVLTLAAAAGAVLTAVRTTRRLTRPLGAVVETLGRVREGELNARADPAAGPAEIRALAEAVNAAAGQSEAIRRHEEEVTARLQALDTVKTDFMSTVSHELRTPLTSISGYLELLRDSGPDDLSDAQRRMLDVISRNTRRLRDLVEDMLTLSKIETGGYGSDRTPLDFAKVIDRALVAIGPVAAKNAVVLHLDVRGPLPVRGDGAQLDRVLDNLLTNAVKFTPAEGTVTVHAERRGHQAVLEVADTGMGIPAEEQQALFGRFFRATNAIKQAIPGTGLGLAIARTIIDNHGGTIDVASSENTGTTITVRLPADLAARETPSAYEDDDDPECEGEGNPGHAWHAERLAHSEADSEAARTD
ncbi:ATP-binding protein [Actinoplanes sp. TRM 88003]|uniref:histidine kinase n=1 Tax=Paractinoplanes aksuensis TaxID=2939490 RepID=A0ABT1DVV2_9ACTN|nr:ATP-binding protein [Actinoplanes aksuensis]MCO8274983.1 ATP-binding protein [Actinoplanes aksuensis]